MKFPKFLKREDTIGLACPSFGCPIDPYYSRYENAKKTLTQKGFSLIQSPSCYNLKFAESNTEEIRAKELMELYFNDKVDFIISNGGGELMLEILPFLDFEKIKASKPKFFMGYSDNTNFTFTLTTICDIASIYGPHTCDFGMKPWDLAIEDTFKLMKGEKLSFNSYPLYEKENDKDADFLAPYNNTEPVCWDSIGDVNMEGRIIGGCLDCLVMLPGTKFDNVNAFNEKYKKDGIIWYLESCDLNSLSVKRALWQLKQSNWFKYVKGFIFGRPLDTSIPFDVTYEMAVYDILGDLNVPIILNADIGHVSPSIPIINGSIAKVSCKNGKGKIEMILKD